MAKAATYVATEQSSNMEPETEKTIRQDYTPDLSRVYRAYDTVARYLTGGAVCAAIVFTEKAGEKKDGKYIILSTNKMTKETAACLEGNTLSNYNPEDTNGKNDKKEALDLEERIAKIVEFAGLVNEDPKHLKEKQGLYLDFKKIIGSQYPRKIFDCFKDDDDFQETMKKAGLLGDKGKSVFLKLSKDKNYFYEFTKYIHENYKDLEKICTKTEHEFLAQILPLAKEIYKRIDHDARKLVRILDAKGEEFTQAIAENKFIYAPPEDPWYYDESRNRHDSHGEMNVTKYLIDNKYTGAYYLGISKLSCFHCANDTVINNLYLDGKLAIAVRGEHGVDYSPERVEMHFNHTTYAAIIAALNEHSSFFKEFFCLCKRTKEAVAEYVARKAIPREEVNFLQADCSDSDYEKAEENYGESGKGEGGAAALIGESSLEASAGAGAS